MPIREVSNNTIINNNVGIRVEGNSYLSSFTSLFPPNSQTNNLLTNNRYSLHFNDHCTSLFGFSSIVSFGGLNTSTISSNSILHVWANNYSSVWVQCNTWNPDDPTKFVIASNNSNITKMPNQNICFPSTFISRIDSIIAEAYNLISLQNYFGSLNTLKVACTAPQYNDIDVNRALTPIHDLYTRDSMHVNGEVVKFFDTLAILKSTSTLELRGSISYQQGVLAIAEQEYYKADSLFRFAESAIIDSTLKLKILTYYLFLKLYKQHQINIADSVMNVINLNFYFDPDLITSKTLYDLYRDDEIPPIPKSQSKNESNIIDILADQIILFQNFPNPFNPMTEIQYQLKTPMHIVVKIYDFLGRVIDTPVDSYKDAGLYRVLIKSDNLKSGIYYYDISNGENVITKKMVIIK